MALHSQTYETTTRKSDRRMRTGGRPPRGSHRSRYENFDMSGLGSNFGSHMPLDAEPHWSWHNPLNILPAAIVLLLIVAIIGIYF
jgi:hypothetical protein